MSMAACVSTVQPFVNRCTNWQPKGDKVSNNQSSEKIAPALLTIPQVCEFLNLSRAGFYKLNTGAFGPLPVKLLGCRKVLYSRLELEAYVRESTAQGKLIPRKQWQMMRKELKL